MSFASTNAGDVMRQALLRIDDSTILASVDHLNLKANTKVSAVVGMPLRSLQQKREVEAFAVGAPLAAIRAILEVLALEPLAKVVEALGEHADAPSFERLSEAVDHVVAQGTTLDQVVAVLAFAIGEDFPAASQCRRLLEERPAFNLPSLPEASLNATLLVPKPVDDEVRELRRKRREEVKLKKKIQPVRSPRPVKTKRVESTTSHVPLQPPISPPVLEIVRRRLNFTSGEIEVFDCGHSLVGAVVFADVPFDAVDPLIPEQRSKIRPVLVVGACETSILALGIYSNQSPSRGLFQPWRRLGLAHVSYIATDRVVLNVAPDEVEKIGRLSDEEWNSLF